MVDELVRPIPSMTLHQVELIGSQNFHVAVCKLFSRALGESVLQRLIRLERNIQGIHYYSIDGWMDNHGGTVAKGRHMDFDGKAIVLWTSQNIDLQRICELDTYFRLRTRMSKALALQGNVRPGISSV